MVTLLVGSSFINELKTLRRLHTTTPALRHPLAHPILFQDFKSNVFANVLKQPSAKCEKDCTFAGETYFR
ncbi:hypothetical protein POVCU2_0064090 [Plasmodium ovale curtisi]|uniref:Uncharacterized protein n=1 Tax=Plasmodium ovale curtisi TaxID=864141 RepID=A0A1A8VXD0_PLAOA|nr:hypothetical protein POVCU1_009790 [Plasmodium ovale curtisi]SBS90868.1 hypothetical protein POVCU2_0064090 [Plasmodium ovale curtisi]